jgi:hypothetical protein
VHRALSAFSNGQYLAFDATGAGNALAHQVTFPFAINSEGLIACYYLDASWHGHGLLVQVDP